MTAYYPSQVGYATSQPVVMAQPGYGMPASYTPGGVAYVPSYTPSHSRRRRPRHSHPSSYHYDYDHRAPAMMSTAPTAMTGPVVMQPSYNGYGHYTPYSWGNRLRRFFGLAPDPGVRYKSDRATWGFMGYSRRQRYIDARTGGEVDRKGRPVYRV